jgi:hypothetical protein
MRKRDYLKYSQKRKESYLNKKRDKMRSDFVSDFHVVGTHWGCSCAGVYKAVFTGSGKYTFYGVEVLGISISIIV